MRNKRVAAVRLRSQPWFLPRSWPARPGAARTARYKVAFITDTAGLNDKSFNHLGEPRPR